MYGFHPKLAALLTIVTAAVFASAQATVAAESPQQQSSDPAAIEFFEKQIRPILVERCFECHGNDEPKGGLRLDSREAVRKGGDSGSVIDLDAPEDSLLLEAVRYAPDALIQMPPKGRLKDHEIAAIEKWVLLGAPWPNSQVSKPAIQSTDQPDTVQPATDHWAFEPPQVPPVPSVKNGDWPQSPLDHFILSKLEQAGLSPAPPADRRTLIRRATYGLIGLPPTPEEIAAFLGDPSPDAFAKVVDRLLASPQYGERWGRHWLDVARYADSNGVDENLAHANAFRYRDYVVASFNRDKPYDQFVREQIAGDLLPAPDDATSRFEPLVATGFLTLGAKMLACDDPVKMQMDIIDEQLDTVGRTFMGLTLGCARCHDHKFDPISTRDYYALAGIFKSTKTMENFKVVARWFERPLATDEQLKEQQQLSEKLQKTKTEIDEITEDANRRLIRRARRQIAEYLLAATELLNVGQAVPDENTTREPPPRQAKPELPLNPSFLKQWTAYLEKTKDDPASVFHPWHKFNAQLETSSIEAISQDTEDPPAGIAVMMKDFVADSKRRLAEHYQQLFDRAEHAWLEHQLDHPERADEPLPDPTLESLRQVLADPEGPFAVPDDAETFYPEATLAQLNDLREQQTALEKALPRFDYAMGVAEGEPEDLRVHIRGSHLNFGEPAPRRFPAVFQNSGPPIDTNQSGRLELARWLTRPDHPLTSRVMVNRLWRWHFGTGLVHTPDNFGEMAAPPVNPELLDWLAKRFVDDGWSIKAMHRRLLLSATYQMGSTFDERAAGVDPENNLRWRWTPSRLEAESIRDAILAVSGNLDTTMGGSILTTENRAYVTSTGNRNYDGYDSNQRSIYLPVVRSALYEMFEVFDFAEPSILNGDRASTTVAPQSLFMLNSKLVAENARHLAEGLIAQDPLDDAERVRQLYQRAYGRPPTQDEVDRALQFVSRVQQMLNTPVRAGSASDRSTDRLRAWQSLCRSIFASSEFIYVN